MMEKHELRQMIVELPVSLDIDQVNAVYEGCVAWFRAEIEKLEVMTLARINRIRCMESEKGTEETVNGWCKIIAQAQLTKTKEDLLKTLEGKEV